MISNNCVTMNIDVWTVFFKNNTCIIVILLLLFFFQTPPTIRQDDQGFGTLPKDVRLHSPVHSPSNVSSTLPRDSSTSTTTATATTSSTSEDFTFELRPRATTLPKGSGKPPLGPTQSLGHSSGSDGKNGEKAPPSSTMPRKRAFLSFGKGFFKLGRGKWSSSAPDLGDGIFTISALACCTIPYSTNPMFLP